MTNAFDFEATRLQGALQPLREFSGQVLLVVNTASECGFTPQYAELEQLYRQYRERGFAVLGFPCNQFGAQEPGSAQQIGAFCQKNFGVSFPLFEKIDVNGATTHPFYRWLKRNARGLLGTQRIKWNFTKFLVNRRGEVVGRYAPFTKPVALVRDIESLLNQRPLPSQHGDAAAGRI